MLTDLVTQRNQQQDLFEDNSSVERSKALICVIDSINSHMGNGTLCLAGESSGGDWRMKQQLRSPRYTTRIGELKSAS